MTTEDPPSIPSDLTELLAAWHGNGELSPARCGELLTRLENDEGLRRQFAGEVHLAGLTRAVQSGEPRWLRIEERLGAVAAGQHELEDEVMAAIGGRDGARGLRKGRNRMGLIRPWMAAAAGMAAGLFAASMVWAVASPRIVATEERLFAPVDGSFEDQTGQVPSGFPGGFGVWSGDRSEIASADKGQVHTGRRALRFVRAEREPALPEYGAASCDVYQLVDLRSLKVDERTGETTLELSVQFRDARREAGESVKFISRIYLFSGSPDSLSAEWPLTQKEALASGSGTFDSVGGHPGIWQTVSTRVLLPPQADFAVVHLVAHKPETRTGPSTPAVFGDQYADEVRLTLKTQPALPVRITQP